MNEELTKDTKVYIATNAPYFSSNEEFTTWRNRLSRYIAMRRRSLDMREESKHGYSIVYAPEAIIDGEDPIEGDDEDVNNILFITKRPDSLDRNESQMFSEIEVPGQYTVIVVHDLGDMATKTIRKAMGMDVVSDSLRMFGWCIAMLGGFLASVYVIKNNPYSILGY